MREGILKGDKDDKKYGTSSIWERVKNYVSPLESTTKMVEVYKS